MYHGGLLYNCVDTVYLWPLPEEFSPLSRFCFLMSAQPNQFQILNYGSSEMTMRPTDETWTDQLSKEGESRL